MTKSDNLDRTKALIYLVLSAVSLTHAAPKPRGGEKLVVINDDGFSAFYSGRYKSAEDLRKRMLSFKDTQVAVFEWCILAGSRSNFPSKLTELVGAGVSDFGRRGDKLAAETLSRLVREGKDTLQIVAESCHESGMLCYASMRMNGDYSMTYMDGRASKQFNSNFWWDHPEFRNKGSRLSYSYPEVRAFKLGILQEAATRDIDGINLDFLRHPPFFGFDAPLKEAFQKRYGVAPATVAKNDPRWNSVRAEMMTLFLREARVILDEEGKRKNRHIGLSARVDWKEYGALGCDIETWLKEGLLDYLVIAQHTLGGYEFDIAPFVKMAEGSECAILFGEEHILSGHDVTAKEDKLIAEGKMKAPRRKQLSIEQYQSRAARWYAAGADGVHLFNLGNSEVLQLIGSVKPFEGKRK